LRHAGAIRQLHLTDPGLESAPAQLGTKPSQQVIVARSIGSQVWHDFD